MSYFDRNQNDIIATYWLMESNHTTIKYAVSQNGGNYSGFLGGRAEIYDLCLLSVM